MKGTNSRFEAVLNSLSDPVLVLGHDGAMKFVNQAMEQFFDASQSWLQSRNISDLVPSSVTPDICSESVSNSGRSAR